MLFYLEEYETFYHNHMFEDNVIVDIKCYGGSPVEISGDLMFLNPEVEEWLETNAKSKYAYNNENIEDGPSIVFDDSKTAMLFKLRWL